MTPLYGMVVWYACIYTVPLYSVPHLRRMTFLGFLGDSGRFPDSKTPGCDLPLPLPLPFAEAPDALPSPPPLPPFPPPSTPTEVGNLKASRALPLLWAASPLVELASRGETGEGIFGNPGESLGFVDFSGF